MKFGSTFLNLQPVSQKKTAASRRQSFLSLVVTLCGNRNLHQNQSGILLPQGNPSPPHLQQHRAAFRISQALDVCSGDKTEVLQPPLHRRCRAYKVQVVPARRRCSGMGIGQRSSITVASFFFLFYANRAENVKKFAASLTMAF